MTTTPVCDYDSGSATDCQPLCGDPAAWAVAWRSDLGTVLTSRVCTHHKRRTVNRLGACWIDPLSITRL